MAHIKDIYVSLTNEGKIIELSTEKKKEFTVLTNYPHDYTQVPMKYIVTEVDNEYLFTIDPEWGI